jgi:hypothetical protein
MLTISPLLTLVVAITLPLSRWSAQTSSSAVFARFLT